MSDALKKLVDNWHDETNNFAIISKRFQDSSSTLLMLNEMIFQKCKEEGIAIESLVLNANLPLVAKK